MFGHNIFVRKTWELTEEKQNLWCYLISSCPSHTLNFFNCVKYSNSIFIFLYALVCQLQLYMKFHWCETVKQQKKFMEAFTWNEDSLTLNFPSSSSRHEDFTQNKNHVALLFSSMWQILSKYLRKNKAHQQHSYENLPNQKLEKNLKSMNLGWIFSQNNSPKVTCLLPVSIIHQEKWTTFAPEAFTVSQTYWRTIQAY